MRNRVAIGAISTGLLLACGPVSVDLGGGVAGRGGSAGTGGSRTTGGVGGGDAGRDQICGDGIVQDPERCDDARSGIDCPLDCGLGQSTGGRNGTGGTGSGGIGGSPDQVCGDGVIQYPEECDDPRGLEGSCTPDCRIRVDGGGAGSTGVGGAYAAGGRAGASATGGREGDPVCSTVLVLGSTECAPNDELLGQAYVRCAELERALTTVRFDAPCDDYASSSIEVECCDRAGGAGSGGVGGVGGVGGAG